MPALASDVIAPGVVFGYVTGVPRESGRAAWEAAVEKAWPAFIAEISTNRGFLGAFAEWKSDDSGEGSIIGVWRNMDDRLAYEARSADKVRAIFNALLKDPPSRYKQTIIKAVWM